MADPTLTDVPGVGPKTSDRLTVLGIDSVATLAAAPIELVASLAGFHTSRAEAVIRAASNLVEPAGGTRTDTPTKTAEKVKKKNAKKNKKKKKKADKTGAATSADRADASGKKAKKKKKSEKKKEKSGKAKKKKKKKKK